MTEFDPKQPLATIAMAYRKVFAPVLAAISVLNSRVDAQILSKASSYANMNPALRPYGEKHAIRNMAFAVEFERPLDSSQIKKALSCHKILKDELPRKLERRAVTVNLDPELLAGAQSISGSPDLGGFTFDSLLPDGRARWSLTVAFKHLAVSCSEYTRWVEVWEKARRYIQHILPILLEERRVNAFGLQYVDEFLWESEEQFQAVFLFRDTSRYLVQNVFDLNNLWHSHHGYFMDSDVPAPHRQHNVVNVDLLPGEDVPLRARIGTTHKCIFDPSNDIKALLGDEQSNGLISTHMDNMRQANKDILIDLLVENVAQRISLV